MKFRNKQSARSNVSVKELPPSLQVSKRPLKWFPMLDEEQRGAFDFILTRKASALFAEQGTGKTIVSLAVIERLMLPSLLIVAPLTALRTTWLPRLKDLGYEVFMSWDEFKASKAVRRILLIHYQGLSINKKQLAKISKSAWDFIIFDESQALKARASGFSRAARRLRNKGRRLILSGTPLDKSPIDVWGQMRFVEHTVFSEKWATFEKQYTVPTGYMGYKRKFKPEMMKTFLRKMEPYAYRLTLDYLNLKPCRIIPVPVQLLGQQARIYEDMDKHLAVKVDGTVISAGLEVVKQKKLEQITGGFITDEDKNVIPVGRAKERKLKVLLDRVKHPVIFCKFLPELHMIAAILKKKYRKVGVLYGKVKDKRGNPARTKMIQDFQAGKLDAIVCQTRTGGVSIELTFSNKMILYSIGHSFIDFEQTIKRLHRRGQTRAVDILLLYAQGTVDEEIIDVIDEKHSTHYEVVSHFEKK